MKPEIAILGAGPVGLEAALAAAERGYPFTVYEAAPAVGAHVRDWGHVRLFSPWDLNASSRARARLARAGREVPVGEECPTGAELLEHLVEPLAALPEIAPRLALGQRVVAVGREGLSKQHEIGTPERALRRFRLLVEAVGDGSGGGRGSERVAGADVVIDATGSYTQPTALGDGGIPAPGERDAAGEIVRRIPDLSRQAEEWAGKTTLLVGAGHSAQTAARDLAALAEDEPGTHVVWAVRSEKPTWGRIEDDPLPERAALADRAAQLAEGVSAAVELRRGVVVDAVERRGDKLAVTLRRAGGAGGGGDGEDARPERETVSVDRVLALTGRVGDHLLYRELQVHECYATSGPMKLAAALLGSSSADCLAQGSHGPETLVNPEPGFFLLGAKSYGRNNTFLMRTGWQQVDEVFGMLGEVAGQADP